MAEPNAKSVEYTTETYNMDGTSNKYAVLLDRLRETRLVIGKIPYDNDVQEFNTVLNEVVPTNDYDTAVGDSIRFLYRRHRFAFDKYMNMTGMYHLVLLTEGPAIASLLGINHIVAIRFSREKRKFEVFKLLPNMEVKRRRGRKQHRVNYGDDEHRRVNYSISQSSVPPYGDDDEQRRGIEPLNSDEYRQIINDTQSREPDDIPQKTPVNAAAVRIMRRDSSKVSSPQTETRQRATQSPADILFNNPWGDL